MDTTFEIRCERCLRRGDATAPVLAVVGEVADLGGDVEVLVLTEHGHRGAQALRNAQDSRAYLAVCALLPRAREEIVRVGDDIVSTKGSQFERLTGGGQIVRACPKCGLRTQLSRGNLVRRWERRAA